MKGMRQTGASAMDSATYLISKSTGNNLGCNYSLIIIYVTAMQLILIFHNQGILRGGFTP
jgi:hypothetical protein